MQPNKSHTLSFYLLTVLLLIAFSGKSQTLSGTYVFDDKVSVTKFIFKGSSFKEQSTKDGYNLFGEGTFTIINNQLVLQYIKALNKDSSSYQLTAADKFSNEYSGVVTIKVLADSVPNAATVTFTDSVGRPISGMQTDSEGNVTALVYNATPAKAISIAVVAFETVTIPINRLTRKISDLKVNMKMQTKNRYKPAGITTYQIVNRTKDKLLLQGDQKQQLFKKIN
ncbi:hypothetical protein ACXZ1K_07605 [Pedobacter sp. PWIIR3]